MPRIIKTRKKTDKHNESETSYNIFSLSSLFRICVSLILDSDVGHKMRTAIEAAKIHGSKSKMESKLRLRDRNNRYMCACFYTIRFFKCGRFQFIFQFLSALVFLYLRVRSLAHKHTAEPTINPFLMDVSVWMCIETETQTRLCSDGSSSNAEGKNVINEIN